MNTNEIQIKVFNNLDGLLKEKIKEFRKESPAIRERTSEEDKIHNDKYCSESDIAKWVIAFKGDKVVGLVAVFLRNILYLNQPVKFGGIGKVRVSLNERKIGIGSKLMNTAMNELKNIDSDVAFLSTDLNSFLGRWYKKYGFVELGKKYTFLGASKKRYINNNGMLVKINSEETFNKIMNDNQILDIGLGNW